MMDDNDNLIIFQEFVDNELDERPEVIRVFTEFAESGQRARESLDEISKVLDVSLKRLNDSRESGVRDNTANAVVNVFLCGLCTLAFFMLIRLIFSF